ncbi:betaine/proline/choline family ABC transporter ATP-binding protein [Bacillaceae bacterium CLA-AA-H227]|nr:betaine/proline/choline family ABC transporter ATP-binding protein [Bacillus yapensis]
MSKSKDALIRVENVSKTFGKEKDKALELRRSGKNKDEVEVETKTTVAILDASFEVKQGETFVLIGLSGSGKSTLLRCLNGLIPPTEGMVYLENDDIAHLGKKQLQHIRRNKMGMVFQNVGLLPNRTVLENITFGLEINGIPAHMRDKKGRDAMELVGLNGQAYKRIHELSGGMQQRVGLARALASNQEILLMDEPFSALDPLIRREMQKLFLDIQDEIHKTVIFVTHDLDEALTLGQRAAVMKDGEIVQIGTAEYILSQPATEYVKKLVQDVDYSKIRQAKSAMSTVDVFALEHESPQVVLRRMKAKKRSSILVVNEMQTLIGALPIERVVELVEFHKQDLTNVKLERPMCVHPAVALREVIPLLVNRQLPVAVVNEQNRLIGQIDKDSLIASLTEQIDVDSGNVNEVLQKEVSQR